MSRPFISGSRVNKGRAVLVLALSGLAIFSTVQADDFWDQGFEIGTWQTDFESSLTGTWGHPLTYVSPCVFPWEPCGTGPSEGIPTWASGGPPNDHYWVVSVNNEPAFENIASGTVPGVPGQAHPLPPDGLLFNDYPEAFAVHTDTEHGEDFPRAHLLVRHLGPHSSNDEKGESGIPFVSIGAQSNRGNGGAVGALNSDSRPHKVRFTANLFEWQNSPASRLWAFMYAISEWNGVQRGVFLTLKHLGYGSSQSSVYNPGNSFDWNWPIRESFFYPGVDWAFIDSEDLNNPWWYWPWRCEIYAQPMDRKMTDYEFDIDLQKLFECADRRGLFLDPMPGDEVLPIKGVHWAVEMSGPESMIWMTVHGMEMHGGETELIPVLQESDRREIPLKKILPCDSGINSIQDRQRRPPGGDCQENRYPLRLKP